ncbi:MAG: multicopper oxidase domain-containing protein [Thermodesulfobacteriota bacterium]
MSATLKFLALPLFILALTAWPCAAALTAYELVIEQGEAAITGKPAPAMTVNGTIPGPVLRFREGDLARIRVHNAMAVETSIHWHGVLVPPGMDGVPRISFPPIAPGATFTYEFPIRQSGTYWYHSHTMLQEQSGVYGALVIEPEQERPEVRADREHVVLLSDWTDDDPHQVLRTLKRGSDWFALEKGSAQSLFGAARLGMLADFFKRELQRMPAMDIADVAYDRFLANGRPAIRLDAEPGETVRLRLVDGSATTYFHLQFAGGPLTVIAADGPDVEPVRLDRLLIAVAETYDLLVRVPAGGAYELRATAHDGSGHASIWLGGGALHPAPPMPRPNLYHAMGNLRLETVLALSPAAAMGMDDTAVASGRFDRPGMMEMSGMEHGGHAMEMHDGMGKPAADAMPHGGHGGHGEGREKAPAAPVHHGMGQPATTHQGTPHHAGHPMAATPVEERQPSLPEAGSARPYGKDFRLLAADVSSAGELAEDGMDARRPWPPYARLRATQSTALPAGRPVRQIRLTLDGDMERYVWFLNNRPLAETDVIPIRKGETVRFILINRTMMHHPMHLHGHFFRVVNGQGDLAPRKHTVDVAPMSTTVIEFDADEFGDWFFHCHLLYHMESGMARVIHYETFVPPPEVAALRAGLYTDPWYAWGEAELLSNMSEGFLKAANTRNTITAAWEYGWARVEDDEWEGLLSWDLYLNRFCSLFAGIDLLGEGGHTEHSRGVFGLGYLLPLNVEARFWLDTDGGGRFAFAKEIPLAPRLALSGAAEYDTNVSHWETRLGLVYALTRDFSLLGRWHSDFGWGAGGTLRF